MNTSYEYTHTYKYTLHICIIFMNKTYIDILYYRQLKAYVIIHSSYMACLKIGGGISKGLQESVSVKQGYILSSRIFN